MKKLILFLTLLQLYSYSNGNEKGIIDGQSQTTPQSQPQQKPNSLDKQNPTLTPKEQEQIKYLLNNLKLIEQLTRNTTQLVENQNDKLVLEKILKYIKSKEKISNPTQLKEVIYMFIDRASLTAIKALTLIIITLAITNAIESGEILKMLVEVKKILAIRFADKSISGILGIIFYFMPLIGR